MYKLTEFCRGILIILDSCSAVIAFLPTTGIENVACKVVPKLLPKESRIAELLPSASTLLNTFVVRSPFFSVIYNVGLCPTAECCLCVGTRQALLQGWLLCVGFVCLANVPDLVCWVRSLYGEQLLVCISCRSGLFLLSS